jgi:hypothetical protein
MSVRGHTFLGRADTDAAPRADRPAKLKARIPRESAGQLHRYHAALDAEADRVTGPEAFDPRGRRRSGPARRRRPGQSAERRRAPIRASGRRPVAARDRPGSLLCTGAILRRVGRASTSTLARARSNAATEAGRTLCALAYTPPKRDSKSWRQSRRNRRHGWPWPPRVPAPTRCRRRQKPKRTRP